MPGSEQKKIQKHIIDANEHIGSNTSEKKNFSRVVQESQTNAENDLKKQYKFLKAQSEQDTLSSLEKNRNGQAAYEFLHQINNTLISAERYTPRPNQRTIMNTEGMARGILEAYPDIIHRVAQEKILSKIKPIVEMVEIDANLDILSQGEYDFAVHAATQLYKASCYSSLTSVIELAEPRKKLEEGLQKLYDHSKSRKFSKKEIVEAMQDIHSTFDHANTKNASIKKVVDHIRMNTILTQYLV
jgi:hypothetical protein